MMDLGGLPGAISSAATAINDSGQVVGWSLIGRVSYATEWSDGAVINLGELPGSAGSEADGINEFGQAVGYSCFAVVKT
jgi:probable HAF family extracellular repeat protein